VRDIFLKPTATLLGLVLLTMSCNAPRREAPEAAFKALEERLLNAQVVQLAFHVTAEGAVTADIHGTLDIETGTAIQLKGSGLFAGDSIDLELRAEDDRFDFGNRPHRTVTSTPRELREALLIGLTRMGILHNLARLTGNAPPDHADGGVRDWVVVDSFAVDPQHDSAMSFALIVAGKPSGSATLEFAPAGHPVERRQTVRFPSGEMRVVERYSNVSIKR
jgi:hypothetical protein